MRASCAAVPPGARPLSGSPRGFKDRRAQRVRREGRDATAIDEDRWRAEDVHGAPGLDVGPGAALVHSGVEAGREADQIQAQLSSDLEEDVAGELVPMHKELIVKGPEQRLVGGALARDRRLDAQLAEADEVTIGQPGDPGADELVEDERLNLSREPRTDPSLEVTEVDDLDLRVEEPDRGAVSRDPRAVRDGRVGAGPSVLALRHRLLDRLRLGGTGVILRRLHKLFWFCRRIGDLPCAAAVPLFAATADEHQPGGAHTDLGARTQDRSPRAPAPLGPGSLLAHTESLLPPTGEYPPPTVRRHGVSLPAA